MAQKDPKWLRRITNGQARDMFFVDAVLEQARTIAAL